MLNWLRRLLGPESKAAPAPVINLELPPPWKISDVALAKIKASGTQIPVIFKMPEYPPSATPPNAKAQGLLLANDEQVIEVNAWAASQIIAGAYFDGTAWLGYTYLSQLAQRPEYRRISEIVATEATRKWIKLESKTDTVTKKGQRIADPAKAERIAELTAELDRLNCEEVFRKLVELDGFFGRAHLLLDTGSNDNRDELLKPIGDGRNALTLAKFRTRGFLKALQPIEPIWCYPAQYNASNPLLPDWYNPRTWFVQGTEIDRSRLMTFVGREVPDLLKPTYAFGGLSLSQISKPYIDNWLRTRQAIADLIWSFSVRVIKTDLSSLMMADGEQFLKRIAMMASLQTNQGILALDMKSEEFDQVSTPLSSLDALQEQSLQQMAFPSGIPVTKLFGSQPAGLNASSQGELEVWYDWVEAFQKKFIAPHLHEVLGFAMLNIWGEIDEDVIFEFVELRSQTEKEEAETAKLEAETHIGYIEAGVIDPMEVRAVLASDPDSPYDGIDPDQAPEPQEQEGDDPFSNEETPQLGSIFNKMGASSQRQPQERDDRTRGREPSDRDDRTRERGRENRARPRVAEDAGFRESDHPRAPDGRFGEGSGRSSREAKPGLVSPEHFSASHFAHTHDDPNATRESVLKGFAPEVAGQIREYEDKNKALTQTKAMHTDAKGQYTPEREALHAKIIDGIMSAEKIRAATPSNGERPSFTILGGRGGSGKSWFEGKVYDPGKSIVLDADAIKKQLPEYEGWNAAQVHEESSDIFDALTDHAQALGVNLVHDATMKSPEKAKGLVQKFKDDGYNIEAHYMHLPRQVAAKRAVERFLGKTRRLVPPEVVLSNIKNEESFDGIKALADKWSFRDNNVSRGQEPRLISESV